MFESGELRQKVVKCQYSEVTMLFRLSIPTLPGPPVIRPGALSRGEDSEDNASITPSPVPPNQAGESHVTKAHESPMHMKKPEGQVDSPRRGALVKDKQVEEEDEDDWNSEDEDLEEESEWEKGRSGKRVSTLIVMFGKMCLGCSFGWVPLLF